MEQKQKPGLGRRAVVGVAKGWSYSVGLTSLARTGQRIGGNLLALSQYVGRQLKSGPGDYRHETFEQAVTRLGLSDEQIRARGRLLDRYGMSWLVASLLAAAWMLAATWMDWPLRHVLLCLSTLWWTSAKAVTYRFRGCQIRDRQLYSFGPWLRSPSRW